VTRENVVSYFVKDISPYKEERERATSHVASVIGRSVEDAYNLIESYKVMLCIDKDTEETWFEVTE
jgi:hypothetical protein